MLELSDSTDIGVVHLLEGGWQQGYYWTPEDTDPHFIDNPKMLANDRVWFTNVPYSVLKGVGLYFKSDRYFRIPNGVLELDWIPDGLSIPEKICLWGRMIERLQSMPESPFLRESSTLMAAMSKKWESFLDSPHPHWEAIGKQASTWNWQGSVKHKLLMGGHLSPPRQESILECMTVPIPDFSVPPEVHRGHFSKESLRSILNTAHGFVSARIERISPTIQDFVSLNRTVWTSAEILWLIDRADISTKTLWLSPPKSHPLKKNEIVEEMKPYSWLDGIRMESLYLCPGGQKNIALDAYLRSINHIMMAMFAEYAFKKHGISSIGLSFNKISIAYSSKEREHISKCSREMGLVPYLPQTSAIGSQLSEEWFADF